MKRPVLLFSALALALGAQAQTYYGNGYTIVESGEVNDRLSGLDAMVFKTIDAYSVQEGLEQLLQGSGWALAGADNADPQIWRLYRQPWPDNKRSINPMPLARALSWVAGDGWSLVVDPVNRLVSFEVNVRYAERPAPVAATVANTPADNAPLTASGTTRVSPSPYDPYASSVSYAASPSYTASHTATSAAYGGSFPNDSYVASPQAVLLPPPAGDYHDSTFNTPPPRKSVREASALRPATTRLADLKTVSPGTDAEKSGKATAGKKARKSATGTTPALLPVSTGEKTASRSKTATPATATARTAASTSGTKAAVTTATEKKTAPNADAARKTATTPATEKAATATRKTATAPAATESKAAAPAAATDTKAAAKPATEAKAANPDKPPSATPTQATTSSTPPAPAAHTPNATSGENHP
ncbi:hypothetical protein [Cardiobacterium hominis]|jgi:transcriptional regulatory protein algP|uniref:hypothetical protein n=1 Tax=Cardiobacterium hominis TaxID=2718 RepID=UPI0028D53DAA|nr:hypothetical protein [Cardiobacterium hominis]